MNAAALRSAARCAISSSCSSLVFGVGSIAMLLAHVSPIVGFGALFDGAFGTRSEFAETLVQTTSLLFPALGIAVAFRAGLFNIGAEGQLMLGGFAAGWLGAQFPLPGYFAVPMVLLAGALAGGAWGAIPGFLRARFGANEVIATLMLNVVALLLTTYLVTGPLQQGGAGASETAALPKAAQLPDLISRLAARRGRSSSRWCSRSRCAGCCSARCSATSCARRAKRPKPPSAPASTWAARR